MACFAKGFLGALVALLIPAMTISQYSDYLATAETSGWLAQAGPIKVQVAAHAERNLTLVNSGQEARLPDLSNMKCGKGPSIRNPLCCIG